MTEWTDYRVNMAEELEQRCIDRWNDLWKFNGGVQPKFWFGDRVRFGQRSGVVLAMQWQSEHYNFYPARGRYGWSYALKFSANRGPGWVHEDSLSAIDTGEEKCQGF